jgi:peptidoglycan/xylan/chitin deacetylase (PgdA/CDA1 family)
VVLRSLVKGSVELIAVRSGLAWLVRTLTRGHDVVLAYHNVRPDDDDGAGDPSLHLSLGSFRSQLDALESCHDVVPVSELLKAPVRGTRRRRSRVAITFDDAYRGAVNFGVAELRSRGLPATIFVAPGRLGGDEFWWDRYEVGARSGGTEFRHTALSEYQGREEMIRDWATSRGMAAATVPDNARSATAAELASAAACSGIELASHSWSHPNLAQLPDNLLEEELRTPLAWLRERFGAVTQPFVSYPYGLYSGRVERAAAAAGYTAGFAIEGGRLVSPPHSWFAVPRLNVPAGVSAKGFVLRTSGLLSG